MKLFTSAIDKQLFAQYPKGANLENQKVVAKIFNPYGNGRWFLLNSDPNDPNYLWAIVEMGGNVEIGSVSRRELETLRIGKWKLPLERDLGFSAMNANELYMGVKSGKYYESGGYMAEGGDIEDEPKVVRGFEDEEFEYGNGGGVGFESTEKLIDNIKKYGSKIIGTESVLKDGTKYRYDRYIIEEGSVHNWLVDLFEKAAKENGNRYDTNFHYKDIYSIAYDRPKYKGVINGKIQMSELIEHPKMSYGGYMAEGGVVDADVFDKLKKGDKIKVTFGSSIQRNDEKELMVKSKTTVGKGKTWESEKITFVNLDNPNGVNYFAYKRGSGFVSFAMGDMAISNVKIKGSYSDGGYMENGGEFGVDKHKVYFSSLAEVIEAIYGIAEDNGYNVVDIFPDLTYGGISYGQTKKVKVELEWNGKEKRGKSKKRDNNVMNVSIYRMDSGNYELNTYFAYADGGYMAKGGGIGFTLNSISKKEFGVDYNELSGSERQFVKDKVDKIQEINTISQREFALNYNQLSESKKQKVLGILAYDDDDDTVVDYMAEGGVTFDDKVDAVKSSLLKRKKVSPSVQKDYGKTYSPKEAEDSAKRIVGSQVAKYKMK